MIIVIMGVCSFSFKRKSAGRAPWWTSCALGDGKRKKNNNFETSPEATVQKSKNAFIKQKTYRRKHRWRSATLFLNAWKSATKVQKSLSLLSMGGAQWQWPSRRHGLGGRIISWRCAVKIMQLTVFFLAVCATMAFPSLARRGADFCASCYIGAKCNTKTKMMIWSFRCMEDLVYLIFAE